MTSLSRVISSQDVSQSASHNDCMYHLRSLAVMCDLLNSKYGTCFFSILPLCHFVLVFNLFLSLWWLSFEADEVKTRLAAFSWQQTLDRSKHRELNLKKKTTNIYFFLFKTQIIFFWTVQSSQCCCFTLHSPQVPERGPEFVGR